MLYEVITVFTHNRWWLLLIGAMLLTGVGTAGWLLNGMAAIRITSYNVCYTKLLRPRMHS